MHAFQFSVLFLGVKPSPVGGCNIPGTTGENTGEIRAVASLAFDVKGWPLCDILFFVVTQFSVVSLYFGVKWVVYLSDTMLCS